MNIKKYLVGGMILVFFMSTEVVFAFPAELVVDEGEVSVENTADDSVVHKGNSKKNKKGVSGNGATGASVAVDGNSRKGKKYDEGEIVVKKIGEKKHTRISLGKGESVEQVIASLQNDEDIEYAEPNYIAEVLMVPNDKYYYHQWNLHSFASEGGINTEGAWNSSNGSGVTIAVIDTGVAYENYYDAGKQEQYYKATDLAGTAFVSGYDFVNRDTHPNDDNGHGTHVTGVIAQSTNNNLGLAGVAFGARIMPLKVIDQGGYGSYADIADAIIYATDNGAKVINLSLGGTSSASYLEDAVKYAYDRGVVVVAAAGNSGGNMLYPAAYDNYVIAVGATRFDKARVGYSSYGPSLDIMAPGGDMNVDQNNDGYGDGILQQTFSGSNYGYFRYLFFHGTSVASPHVAGVAALVISNGNAVTPDDVRTAIESTAHDLGTTGRDDFYGYGLVNAEAAVLWTKPSSDIEVFYTSFETGLNPFTQNAQNAWKKSSQRSTDGTFSAEVDGPATSGQLISPVIDLSGRTRARVTFDWFIEYKFDKGEFISFDVSKDGGASWSRTKKLRGDIDQENVWHSETADITDASNGTLRFRFKAVVSGTYEDGNVDNIRVVAY